MVAVSRRLQSLTLAFLSVRLDALALGLGILAFKCSIGKLVNRVMVFTSSQLCQVSNKSHCFENLFLLSITQLLILCTKVDFFSF